MGEYRITTNTGECRVTAQSLEEAASKATSELGSRGKSVEELEQALDNNPFYDEGTIL